ncbi:MAG: hypothetical protein K2U26_06625 [Cyclobacteriaceae bacterium]|nr:hypothetical protein [Cyclobacteriaceae bacterium]
MCFISTVCDWSRRACLVLFFVSLCLTASSQIEQVGRVELLAQNDDENEPLKAMALDKKGLLLYRRLRGKKEDQIELTKLDTALHENWKGYITISKNLMLLRVQHWQELMFLLFKDRDYIGGDFQIAVVKIANGDYGSYTVKNLIPFNPTEFVVTNQAAMIGGYFNYRPIVVYYSFADQKSKVLPGFFNSPGELNQLKTYKDGSIDVVVSARNFEKRKSLWIRNYDVQGELIKTTILQPDEDKNLIFGRSVKLASGEQIVAGVYGRFTEYSRGIFVAGINGAGEYSIKYYNFAQLQNFFSYMKAKRQKRVKDRIERKKIRGKKIKFNYRLLVHDLVPYQGQFVLMGEAFYPHYSYPNRYNTVYSASPYGSMIPGFISNPLVRGDLIFDGYQYTHAVVIGFDAAGKLRWDNSFEINDVKTMQLEQFVRIKPEADRILLTYLFENTIRTKIIRDGEVLEGKTQDQMKTNFNFEKVDVRNTEQEHLDYWYGDYFYASGIQHLKSDVGMSRRVFFVNKLTYKK